MTRYDIQEYIAHHGIHGQRWGIRNYQNLDGSLTAAGRQRYGYGKSGKARMYTQGLKSAVWNTRRGEIGSQRIGEKLTRLKTKRDAAAASLNPFDDKAKKKLNKLNKKVYTYTKVDMAVKQLNEVGKKEVNRILEMAISEGYNVSVSPERKRTRTSGKDIVSSILYGTPAFRSTVADEYKVRKTRYSI